MVEDYAVYRSLRSQLTRHQTTKIVFRYCQIPSGKQNHFQLRIIVGQDPIIYFVLSVAFKQ